MGYYFDDHVSMAAASGPGRGNVGHVLQTIARRYVGSNPPHPLTYRPFFKGAAGARGAILRGKDYRYIFDFARIFPKARAQERVYAWGTYWSDGAAELKADVNCFGPLVVYLNGLAVFKSDIFTERYPDQRHRLSLPMAAGWNDLVIEFRKTRGGFGGIFGTWLGKHPYYFLMPPLRGAARSAGGTPQEGWAFTAPMDRPLTALPPASRDAESAAVRWLPEPRWSARELNMGQFERLFGKPEKACAVGWSTFFLGQAENGGYQLKGKSGGAIRIFVDERQVLEKAGGAFSDSVDIAFGRHDVFLVCDAPKKGSRQRWGFELDIIDKSSREIVPVESPCGMAGEEFAWMYLGPLAQSSALDLAALRDLNKVHAAIGGDAYWRLDLPQTWVRPYNENALYGRWNYPLGVTLYGLLHAAGAIGSRELQAYVQGHVQHCCDTFEYALWDKNQYGGPTTIHTLLASIDSLDDCGSFGSAMLEAAGVLSIGGYRPIADYVADYISNKQARLPDGTFYRKALMHAFHENTLWADDLYMSVPFLCRYAALTGDRKYLDDAAAQFRGFRERLFIPERKIMSHVFDLRRNMATGVPWGRGNGWTIFSLSELLAVLPQDHERRAELLAFFRELCEGYLALQDDSGMWHQVLTHPDSYPETSCTAMFAYAFARGVRFGWLRQPAPYVRAAMKAWEGLTRVSIDRAGNVHGVCRGSEFSFSPEYYKQDLLWNLNDTHGIGIVLLAGVEVLRLMEHERRDEPTRPRNTRKTTKKSVAS